MSGTDATFPAFFEHRYAELSRLAFLLTGDAATADDLAADALARVRREWSRVGGDDPAAYARGVVAALTRHREWWSGPVRRRTGTDLGSALQRLPHRRRACVVLRYALGLTEEETALALGVSPGTVRGRTDRGTRQLSTLLGGAHGVTHLRGWQAVR